MNNSVKQFVYFCVASVLAVLVVAGAFGGGVYATVRINSANEPAAVVVAPAFNLDASLLTAKSALLLDLKSGQVLYQKNAYDVRPLASLTKLMSCEVVLSQKSLDTPVEITSEDLKPEGDWGLRVGQTLSLENLIDMALIASSNDAMQAAASTLGPDPAEAMNDTATKLGLSDMRFLNATGLDSSQETAGAYGSAYDVARLATAFFKEHSDLFELTTKPGISIEVNGRTLTAEATALPLDSIPGFVAAKTGYTDLAGGNLVAIFDLEPGKTVVAAILGSTRDGRFSDVKTLIDAARAALGNYYGRP